MGKLISFIKASNRWKHLLGGFAVGLVGLHPLASLYGAVVGASCLELKDMLWGGRWDWLDWVFTVAGGGGCLRGLVVGFGVRGVEVTNKRRLGHED